MRRVRATAIRPATPNGANRQIFSDVREIRRFPARDLAAKRNDKYKPLTLTEGVTVPSEARNLQVYGIVHSRITAVP